MMPNQMLCSLFYIVFLGPISIYSTNVAKGLFATKTPFKHHDSKSEWSGPSISDVLSSVHNERCSVAQVNTLFRHGIRNPSPKDIIRAQKLFDTIKHDLYSNDRFLKLPGWASPFQLDSAKELSETGAVEMQRFGEQYGKAFSSMNLKNVQFISSSINRTRDSCSSFQTGFLQASNMQKDIQCVTQNYTIRYFDECKKYLKMVESGFQELKAFQKGQEVQNILNKFRTKLKLNMTGITYKELKAAYGTAGTEVSTFGSTPWIELFSIEDLEVLEYASDLKGYWKKGYGNPVNYEQSCVLLRDIFRQLDEAVHSPDGNHLHAVFRFGHSETLLPLLCLLGLYKDEVPLRADNFLQQKDRLFKGGYLSPFAANLDFVLVQCDSSSTDPSVETSSDEESSSASSQKMKIMLIHNEKPVQFPCCTEMLCPYTTVREHYSRWIDHCDFDELCEHQVKSSDQINDEL